MKIIQQTNMTPTQTMGYTIQAKSGEILVIDGGYSGNGEELKRIVKDILIGKAMLEGTQYTKKKGNSMLWLKVPIIDSYKLWGIFNILKCAFYKGMLLNADTRPE